MFVYGIIGAMRSEACLVFAWGMLTRKATRLNLISTGHLAFLDSLFHAVCMSVLHTAKINLLGSSLFRTPSLGHLQILPMAIFSLFPYQSWKYSGVLVQNKTLLGTHHLVMNPLRTSWNLSAGSEATHWLTCIYFIVPHLYYDVMVHLFNHLTVFFS